MCAPRGPPLCLCVVICTLYLIPGMKELVFKGDGGHGALAYECRCCEFIWEPVEGEPPSAGICRRVPIKGGDTDGGWEVKRMG